MSNPLDAFPAVCEQTLRALARYPGRTTFRWPGEPKHIKFVNELPMTGVGKVDKKVLKAGFWTDRDRMVG
jgi:non-ribosomal peptide synthetase component E (peptide arylation enzyme)